MFYQNRNVIKPKAEILECIVRRAAFVLCRLCQRLKNTPTSTYSYFSCFRVSDPDEHKPVTGRVVLGLHRRAVLIKGY